MERKEQTNTFMMGFKLKNPLVSVVYKKKYSSVVGPKG